ncbi:MAG: hypothetical protein SOW08_06760 [Lachnospiraceae bacterium]|nr:hypothetical protein [Lachnospiraceae bacterium]
MKNKQVAGLLLATVLAMGTFGMTGCGNGSTSVNSATVDGSTKFHRIFR